jgi:flavodoxin I
VPFPTVIYASTSGHTEYVVDQLLAALSAGGIQTTKKRAEECGAADFEAAGPLILASSTWNTGNAEGQLNPHMFALLLDRAKAAKLNGRPVACIALGDERYRYRANAAVHMEAFVKTHGGTELCPTLRILNEPYGQETAVHDWAQKLLPKFAIRNS